MEGENYHQKFLPWGSALELALVDSFINGLGEGTECTLRQFAGDTELGGSADLLEGKKVLQASCQAGAMGSGQCYEGLTKGPAPLVHNNS